MRFDSKEFSSIDENHNLKIWSLDSPKYAEHLAFACDHLRSSPAADWPKLDLVAQHHFPKYIYNSVLKHAETICYLEGSHCLLLCSPVSGFLLIEPVGKETYHILRAFEMSAGPSRTKNKN